MKYNVHIKIPASIYSLMQADLRREHEYAFERVGFLYTTSKILSDGTVLVLAKRYEPVCDEDYIEDHSIGARINSTSIRKVMQKLFDDKEGCFHVHLHAHLGMPSPSRIDKLGIPGIIDGFGNISPQQMHGYLILSEDSIFASLKLNRDEGFCTSDKISVIDSPLKLILPNAAPKRNMIKGDRQSFLGDNYQLYFDNIKIGLVGYGGGGSHIGQQLAHLGLKNIVVFDPDRIEKSNLNRLVGARLGDIKKSVYKTAIAKRVIQGVNPQANVVAINDRWQRFPEILQSCDIVLGCVDSYSERNQLEAECRRYLIPYIDIGMDVRLAEGQYSMFGQTILSLPGSPCMRCTGFLTEHKLGIEAAKYGDVGGRPQVVWPNGVLASSAVGIAINLITGWSKISNKVIYYEYDGNTGLIREHLRLGYTPNICIHYKNENIGIPVLKKI